MEKEFWKAGNMLYPLPVVMVSCKDENEKSNIITLAWAGTICTNPPMVSVSIKKERHSYDIIKNSGEFVINLVTEDLIKVTDYCGVKSGNKIDKFEETGLTKGKGKIVSAPLIMESPVNIECKVRQIIPLGSHDMFLSDVVSIAVDKSLMNETGKFNLNSSKLAIYSHGEYFGLGDVIGSFGYSVRKKK